MLIRHLIKSSSELFHSIS